MVPSHPGDFLRGLFHSDRCRTNSWTSRIVAGEKKRYDYPRCQFVNRSEDILRLCEWALDLPGVTWRRSKPTTVWVSRRDDAQRLDGLIGPKA